MKSIEIFSITGNTDKTEGRGREIDTGISFTTEAAAIEFAKSKHYGQFAVMGYVNQEYAKYNVSHKVFDVFDSMKDYETNHPKAIKENKRLAALAKLTDEEKELLGLK